MLFDPAGVKEYFGVTPAQVTDWKGLMGDSSDNIKGVPGVGEKTAVKLLQEYGTLENVLEHAGKIKGKLGERLAENRELALFSKELATIRPDAPVNVDYEECRTDRGGAGIRELQKYGLNAVARQAAKLWPDDGTEQPVTTAPRPPRTSLTSAAQIEAFIAALEDEPALYISASQLSLSDGKRWGEVTLSQDLLSDGLMPEDALRAIRPLLDRPLVTHDGKSLYHLLDRFHLPHPELVWDTMLGQYILNPQEKSYELRAFADEDAFGLWSLAASQRQALGQAHMDGLMRDIELPLLTVLYDMETSGFQVDSDILRGLGREYTERSEQLKEDVYRLTGVHGFNLNSPQQLGKVLFETLGLRAGKKTQRGYSTDAETLEHLIDDHPAVEKILDYRTYVKFNSTYIDGLLRKVDETGRVHSFFDQTGTATGRISSSEPNLQNIPVRTDLGREIRRAFVAREGMLLVDADYSQIELRVLAHMSGDEAMTDAFVRGQDIHARTASEVYGVPMEEVTHAMRSASKAVNFGIVYGISEFGLARNIGVSRKEAGDFIRRYLDRYPGIRRFMEEAKQRGYDLGYAETIFGRRRMLPELKAGGPRRAFGERVAMNMPVQGTAADIIKLAMVKAHERLKQEMPHARLILQVHDELLIEAPAAQADAAAALLKETMESIVTLRVPLIAEVATGKSWYETK